jgi:hypothetical protein
VTYRVTKDVGPVIPTVMAGRDGCLAGLGADRGELHAAVAALLASGNAWRDADPRRRFSPPGRG